MELRQLRYFVAVAETENFHRASERLNLVPSALSRQIRELETELGVALFERERRRVRLSAAGKSFLESARHLLGAADVARERVGLVARGHVGTLRIGLQEITGRHRDVPRSFHLFRTRYPDVELQLAPMTSVEQAAAIAAGELDAGFFYVKTTNPAFEVLDIDVDDWVLALPKRHRLARKPGLRLRDLRDEPFIWVPRSYAPMLYDRLMATCEKGGLVPRIVQEVKHQSLMLNLVAVGMGLTFVIATARGYGPGDVTFRKLADFSMPMTLNLVWRRDNDSAVLARFVETFAELKGVRTRRGRAAPRSRTSAPR